MHNETPVVLRGQCVERVSAFPYLGSILSEDSKAKELSADCERQVKSSML